jgi:hypothetical protein
MHFGRIAASRGAARDRARGQAVAINTLAMGPAGKISKNLERFAWAVAAHDRENPTHTAWGIGLAHCDIERLGLEEGEQILPGIVIQCDGGVSGNFRVLCDGQHDEELEEASEERAHTSTPGFITPAGSTAALAPRNAAANGCGR